MTSGEIMMVRQTIVNDINRKPLIWYDHVQRMDKERLPKRILKWPSAKKRRGKPRRSWREGVEKEMGLPELTDDLWTYRYQWRLGVRNRRRTL